MSRELARREHDPFRERMGIGDSISGLFDDFFNERPTLAGRSMRSDTGLGWTPAVNIRETDDALIVYAGLPGVERDDVDLEVQENALILTGKCKTVDGEGGWVREELPSGQFYRAFNLSAEVDPDKVKASFNNGILEICLPKAEQSKPHKVEIT